MLGIILGLLCAGIGMVRKSKKWACLGRFLLGLGGRYNIPSSLAKDWNSGVVDYLNDTRVFIRPSANTQLFWVVGGMTLEDRGEYLYGEDVYDFHPQAGQHTILDGTYQCWAFSGGPKDQTRVPATIRGVRVMSAIQTLFRKLSYRYIREQDGYLLFSNDLWNALGGKPFTSVLKIHKKKRDSGVAPSPGNRSRAILLRCWKAAVNLRHR